MAISEKSLVDAVTLAVAQINESGGLLGRPIVVVKEDGQSDWPTFARKAEKLILVDKVSSIFGCWTSASRKAVVPIVESHDNLLWYAVQYEGMEASRNVIYGGATPNQQILPALDWVVTNLHSNRPFLVGSDYVFPRSANNTIRAYLHSRAILPVGETYHRLGDANFEATVQAIRASRADVVLNTLNGDSNESFFSEFARNGLDARSVPVLSFSVAEDEIRSIGTRWMVNHYAAWNYFQSINSEENREFVSSFKATFGSDRVTDDPIETTYSQVFLFARAVARAGSTDPREIRAAALGLEFEAPGGLLRIDPSTQHTWKVGRVGRIRGDGQFDLVWSSEGPIRPDPMLHGGEGTEGTAADWRAAPAGPLPGLDEPSMIRWLGSQNFGIRTCAATQLAQAGVPALPALTRALVDADPVVRATAAYSLGLLKGQASASASLLPRLMADPNPVVRERAIWATLQIGVPNKECTRSLADSLRSTDPVIRRLACDAFCRVAPRTRESLEILLEVVPSITPSVRRQLVGVISEIAAAAEDANDESAVQPLLAAVNQLQGSVDAPRLLPITRAIHHLRERHSPAPAMRIAAKALWHPWLAFPVIYCLAFLLTWLIALRAWPLGILRANQALEPYMEGRLPDRLGALRLPLRLLFILGVFQYHRRVLDAWVARYLPEARQNFENKDTVAERQVYVPSPAVLEGKSCAAISVDLLRGVSNRARWCVLVHGEGGAGKTALACEIARWAMAEAGEQRLSRRGPMVPVLLEQGTHGDAPLGSDELIELVMGQLQALIGASEPLTVPFVTELMRRSRLLIIADDVVLDPSVTGFPAAALVVTSRQRIRLGGVPVAEIEPLRISAGHISTFLDSYLGARGKRAAMSDSDFFRVCQRLSTIVRDRSITALLAKMYAERLIGGGLPFGSQGLPRDIPELMFQYVVELNRTGGEGRLDDRDVWKYLQLIGRSALTPEYRLGRVARRRLLPLLGEARAPAVLAYLERKLRLIRTVDMPDEQVSFTIEPLGEYFAATELVRSYSGGAPAWRTVLEHLQASADPGFAIALWDCLLAFGRENGCPSWLVPELAKILPPAPEAKSSDCIKIGILHSLTGTMAISERSLVDAAQLAIEELNAQGGVLGRVLSPIIEDGASDPFTFASKAERLVGEEKVCALFGCWTSASRKAVVRVVEEHDHLLFYPLQYEGFEASRNVIYTGAAPNQQILPAVEWCAKTLGRGRAFLVGSDYVFPRKANEIVRMSLARLGGTCVGEDYRPLGGRDFEKIAAQILGSGADVIFNTVNGDSNIAFFQALHNAGLRPNAVPVISFSIAEDELASIGTDLTAGHYCAWNYFQCIDTEANQRFVSAFKHRHGQNRVTDDPIEAAYIAVQVFARAVEKAHSTDPRAIREACRGLEYEAPGGQVKIDPENQHTWTVARVGRIRPDGQFDLVWSSPDIIRPDPFLGGRR